MIRGVYCWMWFLACPISTSASEENSGRNISMRLAGINQKDVLQKRDAW